MNILTLASLYRAWAEVRYVHPDGTPTRTASNNCCAFRPLVGLFPSRTLDELEPVDVLALQSRMIELGWCRKTVNDRMSRCRSVVRWSIKEGHANPNAILPWKPISCLAYGLTEAAERPAVVSASIKNITKTLRQLPDQVQRMVRLQMATGMRSTELCRIRWDHIERIHSDWVYQPELHKTRHFGHKRYIPIRPADQYLLGEQKKAGHVFCNTQGNLYNANSYRSSIVRAIKRAGVKHWTPLQLRHNAATNFFNAAGYDTASILLGHHDRRSTARYIDRQLQDVLAASRKIA